MREDGNKVEHGVVWLDDFVFEAFDEGAVGGVSMSGSRRIMI
jgi:hypothetical protein